MRNSPADQFVRVRVMPLGVVRSCLLCTFSDVRRKRTGCGRGAGFREGNQQRGRMVQHIKTAHPAEYATAHEAWIKTRQR